MRCLTATPAACAHAAGVAVKHLTLHRAKNKNEILLQLAAGKITPAEAGELLTKVNGPTVSNTPRMKVTEKGCVQFRGVPGVSVKFGATHYVSFVEWVLDHAQLVRDFIKDNDAKLARKVTA